MPKFGDKNTTVKLYLPTTANEPNEEDRAWVVIRDKILAEDLESMEAAETNYQAGLQMLATMIKDWNFTEDGTPATPKCEISVDTVAHLDAGDFGFLSAWVKNKIRMSTSDPITDDQKKSSSRTSVTASTPDTPAATPPSPQPVSQATTIPIS